MKQRRKRTPFPVGRTFAEAVGWGGGGRFTDHEQARILTLSAGVRLKRDRGHPGDLGQRGALQDREPGSVLGVGKEQIPQTARAGFGLQLLDARVPGAEVLVAVLVVEAIAIAVRVGVVARPDRFRLGRTRETRPSRGGCSPASRGRSRPRSRAGRARRPRRELAWPRSNGTCGPPLRSPRRPTACGRFLPGARRCRGAARRCWSESVMYWFTTLVL